ncbi:uncharacterized protein TRIVIDRAFT_192253 [Trichoderma virens Gv29-8]|uniref:Uncharacterized protein n=1 Tax=Hypocrea virens (strain Gv29-8 / FGSC 10586) TaxID=413071 RepID=G9MW87_HYPVG|nr:uncharacterized protein TRIVIDRAFT_192253 [Trichoderma virens Gv29-8]EHK21224.1 hypothetical protein TRIVIDRAFT_192253 [Trichoderma virens Gv29-8]UKZ52451.1 hypothetical protein TrVGV298_006228 [Trichoderma virens]
MSRIHGVSNPQHRVSAGPKRPTDSMYMSLKVNISMIILIATFIFVFATIIRSSTPSPLPPSHAASDGETIIRRFQTLGRTTVWKSIANISFHGDTFEPEGLVRLGPDRYVVSCGEYTERTQKYPHPINGTDRTPGKGFAHLMVYNGKGERIADATITREGDEEYHNGGIDYDGQWIWGTVAQYRPNSTAYIYKANPYNLKTEIVLQFTDHLGGIVHDTTKNSLTTLNWGSRNAYVWALKEGGVADCFIQKPKSTTRNPSYFVDYQDCKWLGQSEFYNGASVMLCSGVTALDGGYSLGGIALVHAETMQPLAEVPVMLESELGVRMTQNPMDVSVEGGKLRFYWLPDQRNSTLYIYEAQPDSPFEYGGGQI